MMCTITPLFSAILYNINIGATIALLSFTAWTIWNAQKLSRSSKYWLINWQEFSKNIKAFAISEKIKVNDYAQIFLKLPYSPWKIHFVPIINRLTAKNIYGFYLIESFYNQISQVIAENIYQKEKIPPKELLESIATITLLLGISTSILQIYLHSPKLSDPAAHWGTLCGILCYLQTLLVKFELKRQSLRRKEIVKRDLSELLQLLQKQIDKNLLPPPQLKSQYALINERTEQLETKIEDLQKTFLIYNELLSQLLKSENIEQFASNLSLLSQKLKELLNSLEKTSEKLERALDPIELSERLISERLEQMTRYFESLTETLEQLTRREQNFPNQLRTLIREILIPTHENLQQISNTFLNIFENFVQTNAQERQLFRAELQSFSNQFTAFSQALHHLQLCERELTQIIELLSGLSDRTALLRTASTSARSPAQNAAPPNNSENNNPNRSMTLTQEIEREIDTILQRFEQNGDNSENRDKIENTENTEKNGTEQDKKPPR